MAIREGITTLIYSETSNLAKFKQRSAVKCSLCIVTEKEIKQKTARNTFTLHDLDLHKNTSSIQYVEDTVESFPTFNA